MKTQFKLITAAVATAVGLGFSVPVFAADMASGTDYKAERKRCTDMAKGAERDSCMKDVRASEKAAKSERRAARGTREKSDTNPEAGVVTGTDKAMGKDGRGAMGKAKGAGDPAVNPAAATTGNANPGKNPEATGKQEATRAGSRAPAGAPGSGMSSSDTPNKNPEATGRQK